VIGNSPISTDLGLAQTFTQSSAMLASLSISSIFSNFPNLLEFTAEYSKAVYSALHRLYIISGEISLPTIKIQLPGVKYEEIANSPYFFPSAAFSSSNTDLSGLFNFNLSDGNLLLNGTSLGAVEGAQGETGQTGPSGSDGMPGSIVSPNYSTISIDGEKDLTAGEEALMFAAPIVVNGILYPQLESADYRISFNINFVALTQKINIQARSTSGNIIQISEGSSFGDYVTLNPQGNNSQISIISDALSVDDNLNLELYFITTEDTSDNLGWKGVYSSRSGNWIINKA